MAPLPATPPATTPKPRPWRQRCALLFGVCVALLLGEALCTGMAFFRYGTGSVTRLHELEQNTFVTDLLAEGKESSYLKSLYPHPYLGFVHRSEGRHINNVGLFGRDMPLKKDPSKFVILVTGGSVAAQFAQLHKNGVRYLEEILNKEYEVEGKEIVVLNGADGAWKQPQQTIMLTMYADVVDAFLTIDGFNEHFALSSSMRLEYPANNFHAMNPLAEGGADQLATATLSNYLYNRSRSSWLIQNSRLAYFTTRTARKLLIASATSSEQSEEGTSLEKYMSLPSDWSADARFAYNVEQYRKYICTMQAIGRQKGLAGCFFVQPVPALNKTLSVAEKKVVGDLNYGPLYQGMTDELLTLQPRGVPIYSLLDLYEAESDTIYADQVHCKWDEPRNGARGYRLMAERIAPLLAKECGLRRKGEAPPPPPILQRG